MCKQSSTCVVTHCFSNIVMYLDLHCIDSMHCICSMKWLRYSRDAPQSIFYKNDYTQTGFKELNIQSIRSRGPPVSLRGLNLTPAYSTRLPISSAKKKDLLDLLRLGVIPAAYSDFYHNLPGSGNAPDRMPVTLPEEEVEAGAE